MILPRPILALGWITASTWLLLPGCSTSSHDSAKENASLSAVGSNNESAALSAVDSADEEHGHSSGAHGGLIVSLGRDSYHAEAIVADSGELRIYMLGNDESRIQDVEIQDLEAYVKPLGASSTTRIPMRAEPQSGDAKGKSSLFVGTLPKNVIGKPIDITIPNITIGAERFRMGFTMTGAQHAEEAMPEKVSDEEERQLYLTPGGAYTQADIEANGNETASVKFKGFMAKHDLMPKVGDRICPITLTKANPECTWIIGGKSYEFCCPPCVDEFVTLAKSSPSEIKDPEFYVKGEESSSSE